MKTGIELIAQERQEQIEKHDRTIIKDVDHNENGELVQAARALLDSKPDEHCGGAGFPLNWDDDVCYKMSEKSYKDRLIIAGALIAAEIDRIQNC